MKVGILGNGQLGQMLEDSILDQPDIKVSLYGLRQYSSETLVTFLKDADVVSFETENIAPDIVSALEPFQHKIHPSVEALKVFQHRITEKRTLRDLGIPTADFCPVNSYADLISAADTLGFPILLKTTTAGYDGKGQFMVKEMADIPTAWETLGTQELIAESVISFQREVSVIGCRDQQGNFMVWPMTENTHYKGILRYSEYPAKGLCDKKIANARLYLQKITETFGYVGTIALELFETEDGLLVNEVAPRVHNSGHWSIEGTVTSQFRNHMLAISGQAITEATAKYPAVVMVNVIGDEQPVASITSSNDIHIHSYHKEARPNRKLGHVTIVANNVNKGCHLSGKVIARLCPEVERIS